ncbi:MAG: ATP-binding cassette domain-containing protein [Candidatus Poseidoniaceae archaeon]|nr:ATP-binding cassette domain-containing protein [Candidatus Poseidoniaceae archaeon]
MGTVLEARGLVVRRGQQTVLRGADLVLESGTCTLLLGENGTGKSTLMETLLGLHPLEEGQVHVMGKVVRDAEGRRARRPHAPLGVLLQSDGSIRDQSVRHHLAVCAAAAGVHTSDDDVATLADRMGLRHRLDDRMLSLSEGQRRKVGVLGALLPGLVPDGEGLLVLDEPTAALDERGQTVTMELIQQAVERGATVLVGTHHPERFPAASQAFRLHNGKMVSVPLDASAPAAGDAWPTLSSGANRPSAWSLGRRYAWSGGTPLSGALLGALMTMALATLLFDSATVALLPSTALLGLLLLPSLVAGAAGDAALLTVRRDRAFNRLDALGIRPRDAVTPLVLGAVGPVVMALLLDQSSGWELVLSGALLGLLLSQTVAAADALGLRLARPEALHLRLLMPLVVLPFGLLLDLLG